MRLLMVWVTAIISCFLITAFWIIGNDMVLAIVNGALPDASGEALSLVKLIEYFAAWWGPILDGAVILWAIISSEPEEIYSAIYR